MRIVVVGTGYVGLVTGTCLADSGNDVTCVDCQPGKIEMLNRGEMPIYEPGLSDIVRRSAADGRLRFTTDLASAAQQARLIFLTVGTPSAADGSVDLSAIWSAVAEIAAHLRQDAIVIVKSTVPVGVNASVTARLKELTGRCCDVASNPEFLKEGTAIEDFVKPDRVVVGARRQEVFDVLRELYGPYLRTNRPFLSMSPESAEMTKYVANAMLATKISFINEAANLCERAGADIDDVRHGIGHDKRIGLEFLFPGVGYGGSCFPKDVRGMAAVAVRYGMAPRILHAVQEVNEQQKGVLVPKIMDHFGGDLRGVTIAVWGLAFKPGTDDIREAPSLVVIDQLLEAGAALQVFDPVATENVRTLYGERLVYCQRQNDALQNARALVILTEWKQFAHPDFDVMRERMAGNAIFDGRNVFSLAEMQKAGFVYHSVGRPAVGLGAPTWEADEAATGAAGGWPNMQTTQDTPCGWVASADASCDWPTATELPHSCS